MSSKRKELAGNGRAKRPFLSSEGKAFRKRLVSALCGFLSGALILASLYWGLSASEDATVFVTDTASHGEGSVCTRNVDWQALPDSVVAWVSVPGTAIDSPVAQAASDAPNAFLKVDALGQGSYGTPYLDWECNIESPFAVVYGHHMSDGSVFADFASFSDRAFAEEHARIHVCKRDAECAELQVIAADVVNANRQRITTSFPTEDEREAYLEKAIMTSDMVCREREEGAQTFAFVTCSYQTRNSRTVVYAIAKD